MMTHSFDTDDNSEVRAWLYELLSRLERERLSEGIRTIYSDNSINLKLSFKQREDRPCTTK